MEEPWFSLGLQRRWGIGNLLVRPHAKESQGREEQKSVNLRL